MDILVTGGAGFIGRHIVEALVGEHTVRVLDDGSSGTPASLPEEVTVIDGDVREPETVVEAVRSADCIFHQAALVSVAKSIETPDLSSDINVTGTMNVLEAARKANARMVLASSASIYGHPTQLPIDESHPTHPLSPYGVDKLTADHYTRVYGDLYDIETIALRYFNVYGPGQAGGDYAGVIAVFIKQALAGEDITVHGDGEQTRDFVFVDDIVDANVAAATITDETAFGEAYNVGTGTSITIRELAELIQSLTDTSTDIVHVSGRSGDIDQSEADITKIQQAFDYEPSVSIEDGLEQTIGWYETKRG